jgi:hypothetical protein
LLNTLPTCLLLCRAQADEVAPRHMQLLLLFFPQLLC